MSDPLVWLPFEPDLLGDPPSGLRYEVVDPTERVPDSVGEVRFYVPPYQVGPYADGVQRVEVPAAVLKPLLAADVGALFVP